MDHTAAETNHNINSAFGPEKVDLKPNIQKAKFMANRWGNNGNRDFIFGGSKITADGDCNHEIKRRLLLGRKAMTNLDSIFLAETLFC